MDKLTNEEILVVNSEVERLGKNKMLAYVLWFVAGSLGLHNFYVGKNDKGLAQLVLCISGWVLSIVLIGFVALFALYVWIFIDLFNISNDVDECNKELRNQEIAKVIANRKGKPTMKEQLKEEIREELLREQIYKEVKEELKAEQALKEEVKNDVLGNKVSEPVVETVLEDDSNIVPNIVENEDVVKEPVVDSEQEVVEVDIAQEKDGVVNEDNK